MGSLGRAINGGSTLGGPVSPRVYLVETDLGAVRAPGAPEPPAATPAIYATGSYPTGGLLFGFEPGELPGFALRLATRDFITAASDPVRPSEYWDGRVINPGSVTRTAALTPVGDADVRSTVGQITVQNTDGAFDTLLDTHNAVSQDIRVRVGQPSSQWANFLTLHRMRITGLSVSEEELTIEVEDPSSYTVAQYPISLYTGAGGANGDAELTDVQKQVVLGRAVNVRCQLIVKSLLVYQIHDGTLAAIDRVMDSGVVLTPGLDYANYTLLVNATVDPGSYVTCRQLGLFRLGDEPAGMVTADVDGEAAAGVTVRSIALFLAEQVRIRLGIDYEADYFDDLPTWVCGWVWNEPFTYQEALSRFIGDGGFIWGSTANGLLACAALEEPNASEPDAFTLDVDDITGIERISLPEGYEGTHSRRTVRFGRIWQVMTATDFAGAVASRPGSLRRQNEWRSAAVASGLVLRNAVDAGTLDTSLALPVNALALATKLIDLHGRRRQFFAVQTRIFGRIPALLGTVILDYPRFGLSGGKAFRIITSEQNFGDSTVTYYLWG